MDSSGWIEIFMDAPRCAEFRRRRDEADGILVPTIVLYEVYKIALREATSDLASEIASHLRGYHLVPLDDKLAVDAADYSLQHKLAMADAIVYAVAQAFGAVLVTGDVHFEGLPGVEYVSSPAA
jgi:predicted nucleic acid-binding protein